MNRRSVSLPRPLARLAVVLLAALTASAASIGIAAVASAHVSVSSQDAAPGGFGKFTFRVPNESGTASTVDLRIQIPQEAALASLSWQPVPGWTVTTTTADLPEPVRNDEGQEISSYVSVVEFHADATGIGPGEFQEFSLAGGPFPKSTALTFPAVQTYSDGSQTAWIEPTVEGQPEPEHPAPVLTLAGDQAASGGGTGTSSPAASAADHAHDVTTASGPGAMALFVATLALLVGIGGVVLGWRATRRTVSS
jgi:uncharacterized protein YcnI